MKYSVDRIEGDIVVLDNIETTEVIQVNKNDLGFEIREGNILTLVNGKFVLDMAEEVRRKNLLRERMDRLRRNRVFR